MPKPTARNYVRRSLQKKWPDRKSAWPEVNIFPTSRPICRSITLVTAYDALYKYSDKINHILTAHEQGASHAADGYARATGKTGVVITTSGPGATNIVTGIATANIDSIPVVAITGNVTTDQLGRDSFQEVDIVNIVKPITKASFLVEKVEDLAPTLRIISP